MEDLKGIAAPALAQHNSSVLDLVFAMDCTGSMSSYIKNAQQNIRLIVEEIVGGEQSDVRLALVQYRDHPPQDKSFVTQVLDFTSSVSTMKKSLDTCTANGGGDEPEAVADALHQVLKLSWRENATKICVLISDAPPHGLKPYGDAFPDGCPDGLDPLKTTRELAAKGITLYVVGCEPNICSYKEFFSALAYITGGQYVPLGNAALLAKVIIGGAQEEVTLERLMAEVHEEVEQAAAASGGIVDEGAVSAKLALAMKSRGVKAKKLRRNDEDLPGASVTAQDYVQLDSLAEVKSQLAKDAVKQPMMFPTMPTTFAPLGAISRSAMPQAYVGMALPPLNTPTPTLHSFPRAAMSGSAEPTDSYEMCEDTISEQQVQRLVTKAVARQQLSVKK